VAHMSMFGLADERPLSRAQPMKHALRSWWRRYTPAKRNKFLGDYVLHCMPHNHENTGNSFSARHYGRGVRPIEYFPRIMSLAPLRSLIAAPPWTRAFRASGARHDFHFDTHHFVQRLEREGLNRQQAEGIMSAMAEVIDESIRNMTSNMVTKADQEKVCARDEDGDGD
jgi:hypothetical protein